MLSGLTRAVRRGRLDDASVDRFLVLLPEFRFVVDSRSIHDQWTEARALILKHRLSGYDAAYLALAKRQGISLATLDAKLRLATQSEGVALTI